MEAKNAEKAQVHFSNNYVFSLKQTKGDTVYSDDDNACEFKQEATVTFKATFSFDDKDKLVLKVT